MLVADLLSRSYIKAPISDEPDMEYVIHAIYNNIAISDEKKLMFKTALTKDLELSEIKELY